MENMIQIKNLTRKEKLRIMEALWEDLSKDEQDVESPTWHQKKLQNAENRLETGNEEIIDWQDAKKTLKQRFE